MKLEDFKNSIDNIKPNPYMETRLAQKVYEAAPKKRSRRKLAVAAVSGILSLAVLITGLGFGGLWHGTDIAPPTDTNPPVNNELGVLIAYAASENFLDVSSLTEQDLFYSLYIAPIDNEEAAKERYENDYAEIEKLAEKLGEEGVSATVGTRHTDCVNKSNELTARVYEIRAGYFALELDDYSKVKTFKIENSSEYGRLVFIMGSQIQDAPFPFGSQFEIPGDVLRKSQEYCVSEFGEDYYLNKGYTLDWKPSEELYKAIGNNPKFDLSKIEDTIKFTVEFNDGTVKTGRLDLYFDSDGYMHFGK